jgi:hypothetical protein
VSIADDIKAAAQEVGASAQAAADRVTAVVADLRAQLADVQQQLQDAIDAGGGDAAALQEALASLQDADALVDSIEAAPAAEEPPA